MDTNNIIQRARSLLVSPGTEWPVIAAEPATVAGLYRDYILAMAAIPPVCGFVKTSLIGYAWHGFTVYRLGIAAGLTAAVVGYAAALIAVYALAAITDALAVNFGGQQNRIQALKAVGYSYTASCVAGFGQLLPGLNALIALAGLGYSIYLLYLGLPATMKIPQERSASYTAVIGFVSLVLGWILALITGGIAGVDVYDAYR